MANSVVGENLPASSEARSEFFGEFIKISALMILGVVIKIFSDRALRKIEESAGDTMSNTIFRSKRFGGNEPGVVNGQNSSYGGNSSSSIFNNNNSSNWSNSNPFRNG